MATGLAYHRDYLLHRQPRGHPECPERLTAIMGDLERTGLIGRLTLIEPAPASVEDVLRVHSQAYVEGLRRTAEGGGSFLSPDTYVSPETYRIAMLAAGGLLSAADAILSGDVGNAFALVRPPGHHAESDEAMGFCYLNNAAVCARYLQAKHGLERIAIVDWDAHAANGTARIFAADPTVLVASIHQDPKTLYPGTGFISEVGEDEGKGFTVNIPVPPGSGDAEYAYIFDKFLEDKIINFAPDYIIASAGMDSHSGDPLANLTLTQAGYAYMTERLMAWCKRACGSRLLVELEGGYNLATLAESVHEVIEVLSGEKAPAIRGGVNAGVRDLVGELRSLHD